MAAVNVLTASRMIRSGGHGLSNNLVDKVLSDSPEPATCTYMYLLISNLVTGIPD